MPEQDNLNSITRQEHDQIYHVKKVANFVDNGDGTLTRDFVKGFAIPRYDYIAIAYPNSTTETYTYKLGGASGTTVATITLTYTDATKDNISSAAKT